MGRGRREELGPPKMTRDQEDCALAIGLMLQHRATAINSMNMSLDGKFEKAATELYHAAEDIRAGRWTQYLTDVPFMRSKRRKK